MLAHKASNEAEVAAEVIAGENVTFGRPLDPERRLYRPGNRLDRAHRDPGQGRGIDYEKATFPWAASGRRWPWGATTA